MFRISEECDKLRKILSQYGKVKKLLLISSNLNLVDIHEEYG